MRTLDLIIIGAAFLAIAWGAWRVSWGLLT